MPLPPLRDRKAAARFCQRWMGIAQALSFADSVKSIYNMCISIYLCMCLLSDLHQFRLHVVETRPALDAYVPT